MSTNLSPLVPLERWLNANFSGKQSRLRSEISHLQKLVDRSAVEIKDLKRSNAQIEREMASVASSDHSEQMAIPRNNLKESRLANVMPASSSYNLQRCESPDVCGSVGLVTKSFNSRRLFVLTLTLVLLLQCQCQPNLSFPSLHLQRQHRHAGACTNDTSFVRHLVTSFFHILASSLSCLYTLLLTIAQGCGPCCTLELFSFLSLSLQRTLSPDVMCHD